MTDFLRLSALLAGFAVIGLLLFAAVAFGGRR